MIVSILVQSPLVLLFPLRAVYLVQRVMHFASSRHPTDDFLLHFVNFDAKVRLEGGAAAGALHFLHFGRLASPSQNIRPPAAAPPCSRTFAREWYGGTYFGDLTQSPYTVVLILGLGHCQKG